MPVNHSERYNEITRLEKELLVIENYFASANFLAGNESLTIWLQSFDSFLSESFPESLNGFRKALGNKRIIRRTGSLSGIDVFREQVGNIVSPIISTIKNNLGNQKEIPMSDSSIRQNVFVVHGRNIKITEAMFAFLDAMGLNPIEWESAVKLTRKPAPFIKEILDVAFANAQAVVVLFTPDEIGYLKEEFRSSTDAPHDSSPTGQARLNVIFEAGMAMASHPNRTILVECGYIRPFSDISGIHIVRMNNSAEKRLDIVERLKQAGCELDTDGKRRWLTVGDFGS